MIIRKLKPSEIQVKVKQFVNKGDSWSVLCLLYKNARVDMAILDEVFGPKNWEKRYELVNGNLFCTVSVWDEAKSAWVSKSDVGTESDTEAEKGEASDAFKRACTNWGIGRELYTGPAVWVKLNRDEVKEKNGKPTYYDKLSVSEVEYDEEGTISRLVVVDKHGNEKFSFSQNSKPVKGRTPRQAPEEPRPTEHKPITSSFNIDVPEDLFPPNGTPMAKPPKKPVMMTQKDFEPLKAYEFLLEYAEGDREIVKCVFEDMGLTRVKQMTWNDYSQALMPIADAVKMKNALQGQTA
jgi:hypothetical protein